MSSLEWRDLKALVGEALDLRAEERDRWLAELEARSPREASVLREWLGRHELAGDFLETPVAQAIVVQPVLRFEPGTRLGKYRVETLISSGSSGIVLRATQDEPTRAVALKLLRAGSDRSRALARFFTEAEALARLEHPSIARVYDAGTFDCDGAAVPYLAMELVREARTIVEFVREEVLGRHDTVELFLEVCQGMAYAHRRGVIHRDMKPANVLVDAEGRPRIIDFGIARLLDVAGSSEEVTSDGEIVGTLSYMSPEQCTGTPGSVSARSDVYSLGTMLYQLVCGRLPLRLDGVPITVALETILEGVPVRPRAIDATIDAELEAILWTALDKDPRQRYASAGELAADLERYLRCEPVHARTSSWARHVRLFARRRRAEVRVFVGLCAVLVVVLAAARLAIGRIERIEREKTTEIALVLGELLESTRPSNGGTREVGVRVLLDRTADRLDRELARAPEARVELHATLGEAYQELGEFERAVEQQTKSLAAARATNPSRSPRLLCRLHELTHALVSAGRAPEAFDLLRECEAIEAEHAGVPPVVRAITTSRKASALRATGRLAEAREAALEARERYEELFGARHASLSAAERTLGEIALDLDDSREALVHFRRVVELESELSGADRLPAARARVDLAEALDALGEIEEALDERMRALPVLTAALPHDHPDLIRVRDGIELRR